MISAEDAVRVGKKINTGGYSAPAAPRVQSAPKPSPIASTFNKVANSNVGGFAKELPKAVMSNPIMKTSPARMAGAGLSNLGNVLSAPMNAFGGFLQGTRKEAEKRKGQGIGGIIPSLTAGIKNVPTGVKQKISPGRYLTEDVMKEKDPLKAAGIGLATDLVADPLNLVNPFAVASKLSKAAKLPSLATKVTSKAPIIQKYVDKVGEALVYGYKQPEKFMKMYENLNTRGLQKAAKTAEDVAKPLLTKVDGVKLTPQEQKIIGDVFEVLSGQSNRALTPNELQLVKQYGYLFEKTAGKFEKLAKTQTKLGIPEGIFSKYLGKYTGKRSYTSKIDNAAEVSPFAQPKQNRLNLSQYKKREDIPLEVREAMGQIKEPAYGAATAAFNEQSNIEKLKFYKSVAKKYALQRKQGSFNQLYGNGKSVNEIADVPKNYVKLPKNENLGALSGQYVPERIATYVKQVASPAKTNRFTKFFKEGKTILSPKQLIRNVPASQVQAMLNPSGRADSFRRIPEAIKEIRNKGKFYQEAKQAGVVGKTFAATELAQYLPEGVAEKTAKFLGSQKLGKGYDFLKRQGSKVQNANEEMAKMQVFINERKAGRTIAEAAKMADETGFDYSKVTPWVDKLRKGAFDPTGLLSIPFATYGLKAAELTGKTLAKKPTRIANVLKTERAVERLSQDDRPDERFLPDYQKDAMRLPKKDKNGNPYYFNTKYLYPWGSIQDVGTFGLPMGQSPSSLFGEIVSQSQNKDVFTKKDIRTIPGWNTKTIGQTAAHAARTFLPTPVGSTFKINDSATKAPRYSTSPSVKEAIVQEMGVPLLKYDSKLGKSFAGYDVKEKMKDLNNEMRKELAEQAGKPEKQQKIRKFYMEQRRKLLENRK